MSRTKVRVEGKGATHVHVTVRMGFAMLVKFGVEVGGQREQEGMGDSKCVKDELKSMSVRSNNSNSSINKN